MALLTSTLRSLFKPTFAGWSASGNGGGVAANAVTTGGLVVTTGGATVTSG